jgi:hypothetical protein
MTTMIAEVYDALREAGASEEKSRKAAETIANYDGRFTAIDTRLATIDGRIVGLDGRIAGIESRVNQLTWAVGLNIAMTLGVLWRLLAH